MITKRKRPKVPTSRAMENNTRARRAQGALEAYCKEFASGEAAVHDRDTLTDLLSDLRHWCSQNKADFERSLALSETNFESEK